MSGFKRYQKYFVFKCTDYLKYLTMDEQEIMGNLLAKINNGRVRDNKDIHSYVVVNESFPYAKDVWELIEEHWKKDIQ